MAAFANFFQDIVNSIFEIPIGIMLFEFRNVADIPDMVADAVGFIILRNGFFSKDIFQFFDGFEHRNIGVPCATGVINFALPRILVKMPKHIDEVETVDIVADLFSLVAKNRVFLSRRDAFGEIGEEAVKLGAAVLGAGEATSAESSGLEAEIASVFLDHDVGRNFRGAENTVF